MELMTTIPGCSRYAITNYGRVVNQETGRDMKLSTTRQGAVKVALINDFEHRVTKSVKVLVAESFCEKFNDYCDTPVVKNGVQSQLWAENIVWRPRWYAIKYSRQFNADPDLMALYTNRPILELSEYIEFANVWEASLEYGILADDIISSIVTDSGPVWPTRCRFAYDVV